MPIVWADANLGTYAPPGPDADGIPSSPTSSHRRHNPAEGQVAAPGSVEGTSTKPLKREWLGFTPPESAPLSEVRARKSMSKKAAMRMQS